ncbi:hypothetical protein ACFV1N_03180 [Streptosporangium canum]|uniref:hypothetical protein n=1 Tax=Streptosporangium canum TaxID=324952 RepID=UPI0036BC0AA2
MVSWVTPTRRDGAVGCDNFGRTLVDAATGREHEPGDDDWAAFLKDVPHRDICPTRQPW